MRRHLLRSQAHKRRSKRRNYHGVLESVEKLSQKNRKIRRSSVKEIFEIKDKGEKKMAQLDALGMIETKGLVGSMKQQMQW